MEVGNGRTIWLMNELHGYKKLKIGAVKKREEGKEVPNEDEEMFAVKDPLKPAELIKKVESLKPIEAKGGIMVDPDKISEELNIKVDVKDPSSPFFLMKYLEI